MEEVRIEGLPALRWEVEPARWSAAGRRLEITAGPRTDLFVDPGSEEAVLNAPRLLGELPGEWRLAARVSAGFAATFDAGVLVVREDEERWAKLCLERSSQGVPTIVSVVTNGVSDDCNSFAVAGGEAWLRVARIGAAWAFHASLDGTAWSLVRWFRLGGGPGRVGFLAQSPTGEGCTAVFDDVRFRPGRLEDLRGGS